MKNILISAIIVSGLLLSSQVYAHQSKTASDNHTQQTHYHHKKNGLTQHQHSRKKNTTYKNSHKKLSVHHRHHDKKSHHTWWIPKNLTNNQQNVRETFPSVNTQHSGRILVEDNKKAVITQNNGMYSQLEKAQMKLQAQFQAHIRALAKAREQAKKDQIQAKQALLHTPASERASHIGEIETKALAQAKEESLKETQLLEMAQAKSKAIFQAHLQAKGLTSAKAYTKEQAMEQELANSKAKVEAIEQERARRYEKAHSDKVHFSVQNTLDVLKYKLPNTESRYHHLTSSHNYLLPAQPKKAIVPYPTYVSKWQDDKYLETDAKLEHILGVKVQMPGTPSKPVQQVFLKQYEHAVLDENRHSRELEKLASIDGPKAKVQVLKDKLRVAHAKALITQVQATEKGKGTTKTHPIANHQILTLTKGSIQALMLTPAKENVQASMLTPAKENVQASMLTPAKENIQALMLTPAKENIQASMLTPAKENIQASMLTPAKENIQASMLTPAKENIQASMLTPAKENVQASMLTPARKNIQVSTLPPIKTPTRTSTRKQENTTNTRTQTPTLKVSPKTINSLPTKTIASIASTNIQTLNVAKLENIPANVFEKITVDDLNSLAVGNKLNALTDAQVQAIPIDILQKLPPSELNAILQKLSPTQKQKLLARK